MLVAHLLISTTCNGVSRGEVCDPDVIQRVAIPCGVSLSKAELGGAQMLAAISIQDWTAIAIVCLTSVLVVLTACYAWICSRQAAAAERSAASAADAAQATEVTVRAQLWLEAQRIIRQEEFYEARKRIMAQERPIEVSDWGGGQLKLNATETDARLVCRDMDQIAWLVKLQRFPDTMPANIWEDTFSKTWIVLKLLVVHEQKALGPGVKWNAFAELGEAALRKLRWPDKWAKPDDSLLMQLGWKWDDVRPKPDPSP